LVEARRNPLLPDLCIWTARMGRFLGVELKTREAYQPGQRAMIEAAAWVLCRSMDEAREMVTAWENHGEEREWLE
jgi:hypothetical protein